MPKGRALLLAALALLVVAVWADPPGSWLAEPDEPRYAEIPREMLATGDFVVPRLNGVPYFEKPPMLYWANAGSLALLGETPFAARLPTRLAGLGTALLLFFGVSRLWGRRTGLLAAVFFLMSPLGFTFSRLNLTDGVLTFFFTATVFAGFETIRASAASIAGNRRRTMALSALTGALAAGAFLSKGLVGLVIPGGILFFWALATRQARGLLPLLVGPSVPLFALLVAPWLWLAEHRNPGFLQFFFIHEHFQRFATPISNRPGPIYYFVAVFIGGFLPGLALFARGLRPIGRDHPNALFFLIWFGVVLVFFSLSHSKLIPYLFPAFPPAAALAARGLVNAESAGRRGSLVFAGVASALLPIAALAIPSARAAVAASGVWSLAIAAMLILAAGGIASVIARRDSERAIGALGAGWAGFYLVLAFIWPHMPLARDIHELALSAEAESRSGGRIVSYQTYVQGFPWTLKRVIPLADHTGELEASWLPDAERKEIFWTKDDFWRRWSSGERLVVLLRNRDGGQFDGVSPPSRLVAQRGKYRVVANFP
jgi:4-amino-4-deoxy-L-arabinose transferase-like glycosyltransferase